MHNNYINELLGFKDVKVKKVENNDFSITLHIETIKKEQHCPCCGSIWKRSEISCLPVFFHIPCDHQSWILFTGHLDVRIGRIIHELDVVFRSVFFDGNDFKHKCLFLRSSDGKIKVFNNL